MSSTRSSTGVTCRGTSQTNDGVRGRGVGGGLPLAAVSEVVTRCCARRLVSGSASSGPWAASSPARSRSERDHAAAPSHRLGCKEGGADRDLRLVIVTWSPTRCDPVSGGRLCPLGVAANDRTSVLHAQDTAGSHMLSRSGQACAQRRRIRSLDKSAGLSAPSSVTKRNIAMTSLYSRQCFEISVCLIAGCSRVVRNVQPTVRYRTGPHKYRVGP